LACLSSCLSPMGGSTSKCWLSSSERPSMSQLPGCQPPAPTPTVRLKPSRTLLTAKQRVRYKSCLMSMKI
jgi:hypothetical protein